MKTAEQIKTAYNQKKEEERNQLVEWASKLIEEASEKMFQTLQYSMPLQVQGKSYEFKNALRTPEIEKILNDNGFYVQEDGTYLLLKIKLD